MTGTAHTTKRGSELEKGDYFDFHRGNIYKFVRVVTRAQDGSKARVEAMRQNGTKATVWIELDRDYRIVTGV